MWVFPWMGPNTGKDHLERECPVLGTPGTWQRRPRRSGQRPETQENMRDIPELRKYPRKEVVTVFQTAEKSKA